MTGPRAELGDTVTLIGGAFIVRSVTVTATVATSVSDPSLRVLERGRAAVAGGGREVKRAAADKLHRAIDRVPDARDRELAELKVGVVCQQ